MTGTAFGVPNLDEALVGAGKRFLWEALGALESQHGYAPTDFRVVRGDGASGATLIDASPNGRRMGSYQEVLDKRAADPLWGTLLVEDQRFDLLSGCTWAAYNAMAAQLRAEGVQLMPDSLALNHANGEVWTCTILTGDPGDSTTRVQTAYSSSPRRVVGTNGSYTRGGRAFRVRPGFVLPPH